MSIIRNDPDLSDEARRDRLFAGDIFFFSPSSESRALQAHIQSLIQAESETCILSDRTDAIPPLQLFNIIAKLKRRVAGDDGAAVLLGRLLTAIGCDPARTYRHRLFTRVVPPLCMLHTGSLPYHAPLHRDTWLASPDCQINWWMPLSRIDQDCCLAFYPAYWARPVANTSLQFDYQSYRTRLGERKQSASSGKDLEGHVLPPHATEPVDPASALHIICPPGGLLAFSAAHLHASVPNTSGKARLSLDFRTFTLDDLLSGRGAPRIDTFCSGSSVMDFRRLDDNSIPPDAARANA
jgi:hypothetical protein